MNNEKHYYATPLLFGEDIQEIQNAIIIAQNYYGSQRTGVLDRDAFIEARINELERVLFKLNATNRKELPTPTEEI
jgi:hypothetical protein